MTVKQLNHWTIQPVAHCSNFPKSTTLAMTCRCWKLQQLSHYWEIQMTWSILFPKLRRKVSAYAWNGIFGFFFWEYLRLSPCGSHVTIRAPHLASLDPGIGGTFAWTLGWPWMTQTGRRLNALNSQSTYWLVVYLPLWKIWKSAGIMTFPIYGKKKMFQTTNQHRIPHMGNLPPKTWNSASSCKQQHER